MIHRSEFPRLVAGYALSTVGDAGVRMLLAWVALERLGPVAMSGVFVGSAAACLFGPAVGRWLDRYSVRDLLAASCLARVVLMLAVAVPSVAAVARLAPFLAFLSAFFGLAHPPAVSKTIPAMFTPEHMHKANATSGMAFLVASAAGPALGGAVLAHYGLHSAGVVFAVVFLLATPFSRFVSFPLPQAAEAPRGRAGLFAEAIGLFNAAPNIASLVVFGVLLNFALAPVNVALAPLMLSLGSGPQGFGFAMAAFVVGALAGNLAAASRRFAWDRSVFASLGAVALGFLAVALSRSLPQVAVAVVLIGTALPFFQVPVATELQRTVPAAEAGRVFATINSVNLLAAPLAAAVAGLMLKRFLPTQLFLGAAALSAMLCVGWRMLRNAAPSSEARSGAFGADEAA